MLHSTKKTQSEILNLQNSVGNDPPKGNYSINAPESGGNKNTELIHREPIDNSPLWVIGNEETGYFLSIKNYRLTEVYKTIQEAKDRLTIESWNIIARLTGIILEVITEEMKGIEDNRQEKINKEREENTHQENG